MAYLVSSELESYCTEHSRKESALLKELAADTHKQMSMPQMMSSHLSGSLLAMLAKMIAAKTVVEVGMFTGYASLSLAEAISTDAKIYALELSREYGDFAKTYFAKSPHGKKIKVLLGPALDSLAKITEQIDMAFIDADKENYPAYYELLVGKLRPGGILLVDNSLWSGRVLKPSSLEDEAIHKTNQLIRDDSRVENVLLTVRDGLHLVRKL